MSIEPFGIHSSQQAAIRRGRLHRVVFGRKSQVECPLGHPEYGFHMSHEIAIRRTEILASQEGCHWSRATNP